ncbi:hypothetical protein D3C83_19870 [compost metagenome]
MDVAIGCLGRMPGLQHDRIPGFRQAGLNAGPCVGDFFACLCGGGFQQFLDIGGQDSSVVDDLFRRGIHV